MELIEKYIAEGAKPSHEISLSAKINELKEKNLTKLRATEIPHRKVEDWKYTNIKGDPKNDFTYSPSGASYEKSQNHLRHHKLHSSQA